MQKSFCHIWSLDINLQNEIKTLARLGVLSVNPQVVWQDGIKTLAMLGVLPVNPQVVWQDGIKTLAMLGVLPVNPQVVWQDGTKILAMPGIRNLLPMSLSWCGRATLIIGRARCVKYLVKFLNIVPIRYIRTTLKPWPCQNTLLKF